MKTTERVRVLIVDDSSVMRNLLSRLLGADPRIEVIGTAVDAFDARDKIVQLRPDVMTLDLEMPRMDGVSFLQKVMAHLPVPTLVISAFSAQGSEMALKALAAGAVDVMEKPRHDLSQTMNEMADRVVHKVLTVAAARMRIPDAPIEVVQRPAKAPTESAGGHRVLAVASSTGGTEALKKVIPFLPQGLLGTVIVQHMPAFFTKIYATMLQSLCPFEVREAQDGDEIARGRVLIAPGDYHMEVLRRGTRFYVRLHQAPELHGVRPAADFLFRSVATCFGNRAIGLVLTGMGKDGAEGLLAMKNAGSYNFSQSAETCVVYGMPKAAVDLGAIHKTIPLTRIASEIQIFLDRESRPDSLRKV